MLLKSKYTDEEIDFLSNRGELVHRTDYRIDIARSYEIKNVRVDERVSIGPKALIPWFASICYADVPEEKRSIFFDTIQKAYDETNGVVHIDSSESDPVIKVVLLTRYGKPSEDDKEKAEKLKMEEESIRKAVEQLEKLERIIQY